ncbi:undecaprenyl-diphosphate phosphatase [Buchnera aphidicola]|uniref:Undecaprenyl-diphosphatase n=1 Tax=Buchnera aphidicola subsp. Melaphis rhois TaxID=118103 RepID=A0A4D6YBR4_BUCMH|nr:undecaprenyl-diphosphate phosphatase [Buchnera aphidicola]QCI23100.1 undecaprenyl-diphosphate phosphatase [Buchnera aphidicola (Melaphis rhois)]
MNAYTLDICHILIVIILGIIEGITEFFPISSTSHIIIFSNIFQIEINETLMLNTFMQCGTSLSILLYFKDTFITLLYSILHVKRQSENTCNLSCNNILISIFPIALLGLYFHKYMKHLFNPTSILLSLILGSILLMLSEIFKKIKTHQNKNINLYRSFTIGCFQCLALLPGFSRSCSTISIGILIGLNQSVATHFSFIISVPIFLGATLLDIINNIHTMSIYNMFVLLIGFLSSFITSSFCIKKCFKIINVCSFVSFIIYRLVLSLIIYLFFYHY